MSPKSAAVAYAAEPLPADMKVERLVFTVTPLEDGKPYSLVGYLYYHGSLQHRPLQICLHGGSYHHGYWDFPSINGRDYSYARFMTDRKYAVLALDMLGSGESDTPEGDLLDLQGAAMGLLQVIQALRSGQNPTGHAFGKLALVGHSLGTAIAIVAQAIARPVFGMEPADALVSTGLGHEPHFLPIPAEFLLEASKTAYFSFPPEMRAMGFYSSVPGEADPAVIARDNSLFASGRISRGFLYTALLFGFDPSVTRVDKAPGPVLVLFGENDALFPGEYAAAEARHWVGAPGVVVKTVPDAGHNLNLHYNHEEGWNHIQAFLAPLLGAK